ncbi:hypothetical protein VNO77_33338 [Canavalia gladiata]|uniref:Uncharacterized protein n=1 Tax=Canavalia gladiata TaxID=3824 RepID=A0AAN9PWA2_CANGL
MSSVTSEGKTSLISSIEPFSTVTGNTINLWFEGSLSSASLDYRSHASIVDLKVLKDQLASTEAAKKEAQDELVKKAVQSVVLVVEKCTSKNAQEP